MNYTIKDLLDSNQFPGMKLLNSASGGGNKEISGIQIIETSDMERYLSGGEILMTSLKAYEGISESEFQKHMEAFVKLQISGFIVKRNQQTESQKRLFDLLMQYSEEYHLPVIEIPADMYYWGIIKYVLMQIFDLKIAKLSYFKTTHDNLSVLLLNELDVLKNIDNILQQIDRMVGNPLSLYDENRNCIATTDPTLTGFKFAKEVEEYRPDVMVAKYPYLRQARVYTEYIKKFDVYTQMRFYLVITEKNEALTTLDFISLENAIVVLQYLLMRRAAEENIAKKYHKDLGYRMLNGSLTNTELREVADILGFKKTDEFRVITCCLVPPDNTAKFTPLQLETTEFVKQELLQLLPKSYIYCNTNQIIYIHKEQDEENEYDFRKNLENIQQSIQNQLIQKEIEINFVIGIGKRVKGYSQLKESFEDSQTAIEYIDMIRTVIGDKDRSVVDSSKLGFFRMLAKHENKEQLWACILESLCKLYDYDTQKKGDLVDTLECFLNNNQSQKKTSKEMFVHYRTIMYRLRKIVEITGIDFSNPAEMLIVRNGLMLMRIVEKM
jgi:hypothetical protein